MIPPMAYRISAAEQPKTPAQHREADARIGEAAAMLARLIHGRTRRRRRGR